MPTGTGPRGSRATRPDRQPVAVDLSHYVTELAQRIESPALARVGADAMAESMRRAVARHLGGDLSFSGLPSAGRADPQPTAAAGVAEIELRGGAFALADRGRRQVRRARARANSALSTPWGPRESARGSRWSGWNLVDQAGQVAMRDGMQAMVDALPSVVMS